MKVWSYNTEPLIRIDCMSELLRHARELQIAIVCFQSTLLGAATPLTSAGFRSYPTPRTSSRAKDGCVTALSLHFSDPLEVRCAHEWLPGRLLGLRVRRPGARERDLYIVSVYAPTNTASHHVAAADRERLHAERRPVQDTFWQTCEATTKRVPHRSSLTWRWNANGRAAPKFRILDMQEPSVNHELPTSMVGNLFQYFTIQV